MNYLSLCSGVEAATLAWETLGWEPVAFSEIDPFASAVLAHRWPNVPNLGDMTEIEVRKNGEEIVGADGTVVPGRIDLLVGGTPCQGFSVAGRQEGLRDPRSALALCFARLVGLLEPTWVLWENVPGVLGCGDDFRRFAGAIVDLGYGLAWRVLDAQYVRVDGFPHAVPQRRRRLFLIGRLGGWEPAAKVLFEPEGVSRNPPTRIQTRQANRPGLAAGVGGGGKSVKCYEANHLAETPASRSIVGDHDCRVSDTSTIGAHCAPVAGTINAGECQGANIYSGSVTGQVAATVTAGMGEQNPSKCGPSVIQGCDVYNTRSMVRRLTPVECERLMGFPDNHTRIPWRGKPAEECPDGPRYKCCGNSMCVNVMRWIGQRIDMVERDEGTNLTEGG